MCHTVYQVVDSSNREYSEDSSVPLTPSNILSSRTNNDSGNHEDNTHLELKFTGNYTGTSRWTCERASTEYTTPSTCTPAPDETELAYEAYYDGWNSRTYYSTLTISYTMSGNDLVCTLNLEEYRDSPFSNPISHLDISAVGAESKSLYLYKTVISGYDSNNKSFTVSYPIKKDGSYKIVIKKNGGNSNDPFTITCSDTSCSNSGGGPLSSSKGGGTITITTTQCTISSSVITCTFSISGNGSIDVTVTANESPADISKSIDIGRI